MLTVIAEGSEEGVSANDSLLIYRLHSLGASCEDMVVASRCYALLRRRRGS